MPEKRRKCEVIKLRGDFHSDDCDIIVIKKREN
jgi:hypothetical protein